MVLCGLLFKRQDFRRTKIFKIIGLIIAIATFWLLLWQQSKIYDPTQLLMNAESEIYGAMNRTASRAAQSDKALRERPRKNKHRVQHAELLNKQGFWWLTGALVFSVGVAVVRAEIASHRESIKSKDKYDDADGGIDFFDALSPSPSPTSPASAMPRLPDKPDFDARGLTETGLAQWWKHNSIGRRMYCVLTLNIAMLLWGVSQEFVMSNEYGQKEGKSDRVPSALFVVFCNRVSSALFSAGMVWAHGQSFHIPGKLTSASVALSNCLSSWCQYQSLYYISFQLQTMAKSAKMLPVMLLGSWRGKRYSALEYAETLVVVCALAVFGFETQNSSQSYDTTVVGVGLLSALLIFDACTPHLQEVIFKTYPSVSVTQATLMYSTIAAAGLFAVQIANGSFFGCFQFLSDNPEAILHLSVLSLSSTLTQYFILYTIKHFGPVFFSLVASTRQVIAVCLSAALFDSRISSLASVAVMVIFGTVVVRGLRSALDGESTHELSTYVPLLLCAAAIHVLHCFYAVMQEFLAVHTFQGEIFRFPASNVLFNHLTGAILAWAVLWFQQRRPSIKNTRVTLLPALANFTATFCQHKALYYMSFPAQTLMKTLKVIPVMLVGRCLKNRRYSCIDYIDSALITGLVAYFVWDFQVQKDKIQWNVAADASLGISLMIGYLCADAFTSNLQDHAYQITSMDSAEMLYGLELISSFAAFVTLVVNGQLASVISFLLLHTHCLFSVMLMAMTSACAAFACTVTVRRFGPAIFTLLMVSRQVSSLVISVVVFGHEVNFAQCLCLVAISLLILSSSVRRASAQFTAIGRNNSDSDLDSGRAPPTCGTQNYLEKQ